MSQAHTYGDKQYRKIDIHEYRDGAWHYSCSTTWSRTCKEAKERYVAARPWLTAGNVRAWFAVER